MKKKVNETIRPVIRQMKTFEWELFPIEKAATVRNTCSAIALSTGMTFRTSQKKRDGVIEVTRIS